MVLGAWKATPPDAFAGSLGAESNEGHCCLTGHSHKSATFISLVRVESCQKELHLHLTKLSSLWR